MDAIWLYKIIYPLFFCLVPLALFHTYREQIGVKRAFFSAFFFMAMITFFGEMTSLARQEVAELYFALVILLMIDRRLTLAQRTILTIIFATALIVSHYALGLFFTAFLLIGWVWLVLVRSKGGIIWKWLTSKFGGLPQSLISDRAFPAKIMVLIVVIYLAFALVWYGGIAQGYALHVMKSIGSSQYSLLSTEALNLIPTEPKITEPALTKPAPTKPKSTEPKTTEPTLTEPVPAKTTPTSLFVDPKTRQSLVLTALGLDFFSVSPLGKVFRVFQYITELFIIVGFIGLILKPRRFKGEYIALTMVSALILFLCIVMPRFSSYLNVTRFYHITLFLLSPLCILGGEAIWRGVSQLKVKRRLALSSKSGASGSAYLRFLALGVLIPYFLFNTGFFFEVTGSQLYGVNDSPSSWALTSYRLDMPVHNQREVAGTKWLSDAANDETKIYADQFGKLLLHTEFLAGVNTLTLKMKGVPQNSYAYLTTLNIERNEAVFIIKQGKQVKFEHISFDEIPDLFKSITNKNLTYNNGGAQIFSP